MLWLRLCRRLSLATPTVLAAALALAGCGQQRPATHSPNTAIRDTGQHGTSGAGTGLPSSHVHGVALNPADGRVYLATHEGLFRMAATPERVGPVIDLMGFTVAGPDHFYASGHPGPATDMTNPVGLIESRDSGMTWRTLSRQGQSDFHALAASTAGVVGFDGALRASADGTSWTELHPPVAPYALAASPNGQVLVGTNQSGPIRSTDGGATWQPIDGAPLLQLVDWADTGDVVAGATPDGEVAVSTDAGANWRIRGQVDGPPQALGTSGSSGSPRILIVTETELLESIDGGATFRRYQSTD